MPTEIKALLRDDGSGVGGLIGEHELCALSYDPADEPTEVVVPVTNEGGNISKSTDLSLMDDNKSPIISIGMPKFPSKKMSKRALTLGLKGKLLSSNNSKEAAKENASPQKGTNRRSFPSLGCKTAFFTSGGGSDMNDVKDIGGSAPFTVQKKVSAQPSVQLLTDEHSLSDDDESGSSSTLPVVVVDKSLSKKLPKKALAAIHSQEGELKEINSALNNHMSAVLKLLRQTGTKSVMNIPGSLINPLREKTMTALRNADYCFHLSRALLVPEKDAIQLYAEEVMKKKEEEQQRLEDMKNGRTGNKGQFQMKTKALLVASANGNNATLPRHVPKRPRESEKEKEPVKKRSKRKKCSWEGCTNNAVKGGVCMRHGATQPRCSKEGCTKNAQKGGVCWRHGAKDLMKKA